MLISILAVLVICAGLYGVLKWQEVSKQEIIEDIEIDLCAFEAQDISKIEIKDSENIAFKKENAIWKEEQKTTLEYNQALIQEMVTQITALTSIQSIGNVQDPIVYGITENSKMITVYTKENSIETFRIGQEAAGKTGIYIGRDADEKIYMVPKEKISTLFLERADFVEASLTLPNRETIVSFAVENTNGESFKAILNHQKGYAGYEKWLLESPYKNKQEVNTEQMEAYLDTIYQFSFEKFITDEATDLSRYGLDVPSFVVHLNEAFKIYFGNKEGNVIYVMTSQEPYVYTMAADKLGDLQKIDTFKMIKKQIYTPVIEQVEKIYFKNGTEKFTLKLETKKDETGKESLQSMLQNTSLDEATTKTLFEQITALNIKHRLVNPEVEEKQEREAEVIITYVLKDKTSQKIEFIPYDPSFYILRYQNLIEFAVDKKQVVDLFNTLADLIKNS